MPKKSPSGKEMSLKRKDKKKKKEKKHKVIKHREVEARKPENVATRMEQSVNIPKANFYCSKCLKETAMGLTTSTNLPINMVIPASSCMSGGSHVWVPHVTAPLVAPPIQVISNFWMCHRKLRYLYAGRRWGRRRSARRFSAHHYNKLSIFSNFMLIVDLVKQQLAHHFALKNYIIPEAIT
jgi:hypothetical protein